MTALLGTLLAIYLAAMFVVGWWARGRIDTSEDFLVAGRRLPLWMVWPTLLATWFGAGTLLTATDEVRAHGLRMAALDPIGAGLCLLVAAAWLARPLWEMQLLTLGDFFARRFGPRAELASALLMIPTYFGWIAAQFVALAGLFELFFGVHPQWGIAAVAVIGTSYTLMGGMWSVTATDVVQMTLVVLGLVVLTGQVLMDLGGGLVGGLVVLAREVPEAKQVLVPRESAAAFLGWVGVLAVGTLGNLPGQDLFARVFASKDARTAVRACWLAGASYLVLGAMPLALGLAADLLLPGHAAESTLGLLARLFLTPLTGSLLMLAVVSAVLSTIDSAILSPAALLSENVLRRVVPPRVPPLTLHRICVLVVALGACVTAYWGERAYTLLEDAYALGLVSLLVPLLVGIKSSRGTEAAALVSMTVGTGGWLLHRALGWETFLAPLLPHLPLPMALCCALASGLAYAGTAALPPRRARTP